MKHVFKKSVVAAGILACLFASSAFAETVTTTPEQDKATQAAALEENKAYDASHGYTNKLLLKLKWKKKQQKRKKRQKKRIWQ